MDAPELVRESGSPFRLRPTIVGGWTYRTGDPADEAATIDLLQRAFRRWPPWPTSDGARGLLSWYADGFAAGTGGWIVASSGTELTSVGLGFVREARLNSRTVLGVQEGFIAVAPEYRGRGGSRMYLAMARQASAVGIVWGFTQVESLRRIRQRDRAIEPANPLRVRPSSEPAWRGPGSSSGTTATLRGLWSRGSTGLLAVATQLSAEALADHRRRRVRRPSR